MTDRAAITEERILDLVHLARQTFGDKELERELLALFEEQCRRLVPVVTGSAERAERSNAAHTLKGAARAIGAWRIAAAAETLEGALSYDPRGSALSAAIADLERAVLETRDAAAQWGRAA